MFGLVDAHDFLFRSFIKDPAMSYYERRAAREHSSEVKGRTVLNAKAPGYVVHDYTNDSSGVKSELPRLSSSSA